MNHRTSKRIMIFIVITVLFNSFTISVTATPYIQTDRPRVVKTISLSHPIDIAINMSAKRAYVVSADDDTRDRLLIIDSDSYAVVKERFIDNGASVIAVNPNTGNLFLGYTFPSSYILVLDSALNIIHRLDTAIINMLATGQGQTLAVDPSEGYIYVLVHCDLNAGLDGWIRIRDTTFEVSECHPLEQGDQPTDLALNAQDHRLFITTFWGGFYVYEGDNMVAKEGEARLESIAINEVDGKIYISRPRTGEAFVYDNKTLQLVVGPVNVEAALYTLHFNFFNGHLYGTRDSLIVLDGVKLSTLHTVAVGSTGKMAIDSPRNRIWITGFYNDITIVQDTAGSQLQGLCNPLVGMDSFPVPVIEYPGFQTPWVVPWVTLQSSWKATLTGRVCPNIFTYGYDNSKHATELTIQTSSGEVKIDQKGAVSNSLQLTPSDPTYRIEASVKPYPPKLSIIKEWQYDVPVIKNELEMSEKHETTETFRYFHEQQSAAYIAALFRTVAYAKKIYGPAIFALLAGALGILLS